METKVDSQWRYDLQADEKEKMLGFLKEYLALDENKKDLKLGEGIHHTDANTDLIASILGTGPQLQYRFGILGEEKAFVGVDGKAKEIILTGEALKRFKDFPVDRS